MPWNYFLLFEMCFCGAHRSDETVRAHDWCQGAILRKTLALLLTLGPHDGLAPCL